MVPRSYQIRHIGEADRADNAWRIERAEARGDPEEAQILKDVFAEWEQEQGQTRERLVCAVCGDPWLSPTAKETARPHRRRDVAAPSWDRVRELRQDIQTLQAELERVLEALEP